jgi:GTP pyrophosphokinase
VTGVKPTSTITPSINIEALQSTLTALEELDFSGSESLRGHEVASELLAITDDQPLAIAAWLDTTRKQVDRPISPATLRSKFGAEVAGLVDRLTRLGEFQLDAKWATGKQLAEDQTETIRKMLLAVIGDPRLVIARIAQQLVRIRHCRGEKAATRRQIAMEVQELYAPLANRLGIWALKWELEDLSFRELEPAAYQQIAKALNEKRVDREHYISQVLEQLNVALRAAGLSATTQGRPKHIFSIYRKMQRKQLSFAQVYDIRAVRVIVPSISDCYAALGVVHQLWPILPTEFDDYIATPKENHYRSIHTAVQGPAGRSLEVQIRTLEMQDHAELGVAAHWRYKEGGEANQDYERKISQLRELLLGKSKLLEADGLQQVSASLFSDRIYTMTPKGEVIDLPQGGTPLDFAFHVHSDLGERCRGAKVNGRIATLTHALSSGDVVEIITGKQAAPSRDWLSPTAGFLKSSRSKAKLRAYFRRHDLAVTPSEPEAPVATPVRQEPRSPARPSRAIRKSSGKVNRSPVAIDGVGDLPITLARCCAPVPPQTVLGYLTLGRGVTIHVSDCPGLARMVKQKPQRLLKVDWTDDNDARIAATITIDAFDRKGLLRDISDVIAAARLSIDGVRSHTDPKDRIAHFEVRLTIHDATELAKLQRQLARIPNVFKTRRAH